MTEQHIESVPEWTLGWRIRRAMDYAGLGRDELARELGYATNTISNWLHDKGPVRPVVLKQIAMRCGVDYEWLKTGKRASGEDGITPNMGENPGEMLASEDDFWAAPLAHAAGF